MPPPPKSVQIPSIDDEIYTGPERHAAAAGTTVPELLRREATRLAAEPTMARVEEWLEGITRHSTAGSSQDSVHSLDATRGRWPEVAR